MVERRHMSNPSTAPAAIVTGAGRGIGRAAAIELARRGYCTALAARSADELAQTAELAGEVSPAGIHHRAIVTDVTQPAQVDALIQGAMAAFGRIDAAVHCAGLAPAVPVEKMEPTQWRAVIETNLSAAFYLARALWPVFRRQRQGVIVNISSPACRDPFPGFAAYGAAKAGLNVLSLVLAREGAAIGVRAHTIAPGATETAMFRALMSQEAWPAEKTLAPREVAELIAACVCGELRYTSGEVIFVSKAV